MRKLYVIYDSACGFCCRRCRWLGRQPAFIDLQFIPRHSPEVTHRFPGIRKFLDGDELLVVSDGGAVYRGVNAWIICLYALQEYREWSAKLAHPILLPLARQACELFVRSHPEFSQMLRLRPDEEIAGRIRRTLPQSARISKHTLIYTKYANQKKHE